jgi:hypothetical protein
MPSIQPQRVTARTQHPQVGHRVVGQFAAADVVDVALGQR